jgi:hypothetical protein
MSRKSGAAPYRLDNPCALMMGGKLLVVLPQLRSFQNTVATREFEAAS